MNTTKNAVVLLLALTSIGGAVLVWKQHQELLTLRASALSARDRSDLLDQIKRLQQENRDLEQRLAAQRGRRDSERTIAGNEDGEGTTENAPGARVVRRGQPMGALRELLSKPEAQALISANQKAAVDSRYAALFRKLNLTPEQAGRLSTLLLERQNTVQDVMAAAREQGLDPRAERESIRKLIADAQGTVDASIKTLLGDTGYNQLATYEQTLPQRGVVNALQQQLLSSDTPLSATQVEQLVEILAASTAPRTGDDGNPPPPPRGEFGGGPGFGFGLGGGPGGSPMGPGAATISSEAVAQAQTVLSASQLAALQQLQQQQQNERQLRQLIQSSGGGRRRPGG